MGAHSRLHRVRQFHQFVRCLRIRSPLRALFMQMTCSSRKRR
jgi:hypothetical protein